MKKRYLVLLLVPLIIALSGCGKKRHYVAPPPSPFAPFDLVATAVSSTQIDLTWKETCENEKGFYVYRNNQKIAVLEPNTTSYNDLSLKPETTYYYEITTYTNDGESTPSNKASATTPAEVEILDYRMEKYYGYSEEWHTTILGNVKNNTNRVLTIWIKGNFFSYKGTLIATEEDNVANVDSGKVREFWIRHDGKTEIERVEAWVDRYY